MSHTRVQVRGSSLWARKKWVIEQHGAARLESLLGELTPAGRNLIHEEIDRSAWYSFPLFVDWCGAVDRVFGPGDGTLNIELARFSAHHNTPALYHMFIRLGSVDWVLGKATKLWSENFSAGEFTVHHETGTRVAIARLIEWPTPHIVHSYSVLGFAIGCIELSGEKNVRGELVSCPSLGGEETVLRVSWGEPD